MDFFGLSPLNIIIILGVALIVFGPERLPEMAAKAGKFVRDLQSYTSSVTGEFGGEFNEIRQHFEGVQDEMRSFGNEMRNTGAEVGSTVRDLASGVRDLGQTTAGSSVAGVNTPPPSPELSGPELSGKVVPLTTAPIRPRVDDYKPGS